MGHIREFSSGRTVNDIRRTTRERDSTKRRVRGLKGLPRTSVAPDLGFLDIGKRSLAGHTAAPSGEVRDLPREAQNFKEAVAKQALELRLL